MYIFVLEPFNIIETKIISGTLQLFLNAWMKVHVSLLNIHYVEKSLSNL